MLTNIDKCLTSVVMKEMQIYTIAKYHFTAFKLRKM